MRARFGRKETISTEDDSEVCQWILAAGCFCWLWDASPDRPTLSGLQEAARQSRIWRPSVGQVGGSETPPTTTRPTEGLPALHNASAGCHWTARPPVLAVSTGCIASPLADRSLGAALVHGTFAFRAYESLEIDGSCVRIETPGATGRLVRQCLPCPPVVSRHRWQIVALGQLWLMVHSRFEPTNRSKSAGLVLGSRRRPAAHRRR